jgi:transcriptional regulator GlxA family with amidase domain
MANPSPRTVGIFIFDGVEVLDFAGPYEVFSVARPVGEDDDATGQIFRPITIAAQAGPITTTGGLVVQPAATIANHPELDLLLIPGGRGTRQVRHQGEVIAWIAAQAQASEIAASVCTGAFLLAEAGLLDGLTATTYWSSVPVLAQSFPNVGVDGTVRYVDNGHIVTSAGVSAGIDMSLHLVARLHGPAVADWTARRMEYEWWAQAQATAPTASPTLQHG